MTSQYHLTKVAAFLSNRLDLWQQSPNPVRQVHWRQGSFYFAPNRLPCSLERLETLHTIIRKMEEIHRLQLSLIRIDGAFAARFDSDLRNLIDNPDYAPRYFDREFHVAIARAAAGALGFTTGQLAPGEIPPHPGGYYG